MGVFLLLAMDTGIQTAIFAPKLNPYTIFVGKFVELIKDGVHDRH